MKISPRDTITLARPLLRRVLLSLSLLSVIPAIAQTQGAITNADLVKMIQGGLPESVIVNKIRASTATLDTSVDALLALKKAGATEAELAAMTAAPATTTTLAVQQTAPLQDAEPVDAFGAQVLHTRAGDPYLKFPSQEPGLFPNGLESNTAFLVRYKGEIGVLVPATRFFNPQGDAACMLFNAIFLHDRLVVDRYLDFACDGGGTVPAKLLKDGNGIDEFPRTGLSLEGDKGFTLLDDNGIRQSDLRYRRLKWTDGVGKKKFIMNDQVIFGVFPIGFGYNSHSDRLISPLFDPFIDQLINHFDETVTQFERAAGITNPLNQLSPRATYQPITVDQAKQFQMLLDRRWKMAGKQKGLSFADLVQGFNATQQMTSGVLNSAVGISNGNTAQLGSGLQNMATASGSQPLANVSAAANGSSSNPLAQSAAVTAGGSSGGLSYVGPNSEWVHKILATVGAYSCTPAGKPQTPNTFSCAGRDGYVYSAQILAWASECSQETGHPDDAVKDANLLVDTLKNAGDLCAGMPTTCTTDNIISCGQLPRH